ncbi:DUF58 domain-containing protein [Psychromonas arctica]|uniref:DUF58 domain-containing protein n=1 Tax=Psychromonas arctica TaxID=168275 RepID=A0ABU9HFQ6_9GAMM
MTATKIANKFKALINQRFDRWLIKRIPVVDSITLNRGNSFIFPSRFGLMFLATCVILFLIGTNYQNNLILFLVYFLLSFMITCLLLSYQNLSGLRLTASPSEDQFANENCTFALRLTLPKNAKSNRAQQTRFTFKQASSTFPSSIAQPLSEQQNITLFAKSTKRGWFKPGRVTVQSYYPFGLFRVWSHIDFGFSSLLYPTPVENALNNVVLSGEETDVGNQAAKVGFDTFSTLKPFQQGESLKSIAWKQVAQGKGTFTKLLEEERGGDVFLSLSAFNGVPTEERLSMLAYQVLTYEQQGISYALDLGTRVIDVGSGAEHQQLCLRALALYGDEHA